MPRWLRVSSFYGEYKFSRKAGIEDTRLSAPSVTVSEGGVCQIWSSPEDVSKMAAGAGPSSAVTPPWPRHPIKVKEVRCCSITSALRQRQHLGSVSENAKQEKRPATP